MPPVYRALLARWLFLWAACVTSWPLQTAHAANEVRRCAALFGKGQYATAGACFAGKIPTKDQMATQPREKQIGYGRRLRNAALAYSKAAKAAKQVESRAYFQEKAVALLQRYLDESLYESSMRQKSAEVMQHRLRRGLRYVALTILPGAPKARVVVRGFRFLHESTGRWSKMVRPGKHRVTIWYPGQPKPREFQLTARPGSPIVRQLTPPPPTSPSAPTTQPTPKRLVATRRPAATRRPVSLQPRLRSHTPTIRALGWATAAIGAMSAAAGIACIGVGGWAYGEMDGVYQEARRSPAPTIAQVEQIQSLRGLSESTFIAGGVSLGVGVAFGIVGIVLLRQQEPRPTRPPQAPAHQLSRDDVP